MLLGGMVLWALFGGGMMFKVCACQLREVGFSVMEHFPTPGKRCHALREFCTT